MKVVVNGQERDLGGITTVAQLVRALGRDPDRPGTAIARNGDVVPRREWEHVEVRDGDTVEVVVAVGGG